MGLSWMGFTARIGAVIGWGKALPARTGSGGKEAVTEEQPCPVTFMFP